MKPPPASVIARKLKISPATAYRALDWLKYRDWIAQDRKNGWMFIRGLNWVHEAEGWIFARAAIMSYEDLKQPKAFFTGVVLANLVISGIQGTKTGRKSRRPEQLRHPVSVSVLANTIKTCECTALKLRKIAETYGYIRCEDNLIEITNITPSDLEQMRYNHIDKFPFKIFGFPGKRVEPLGRVRHIDGKLYLQESNLIYPKLKLKSRRGTSKWRKTNHRGADGRVTCRGMADRRGRLLVAGGEAARQTRS